MAEQMTNYQCPACRGSMFFDPATGKLKCEYCGSLYTVEEVKAYFAKENEQAVEDAQLQAGRADEENEEWGANGENLKEYACKSCGAHLVTDQTTAASSCPYCGNPTVIPQQFSGMARPKYVIPFQIEKGAAKEKLKQYYKGKKLLPKNFTDENHIEEIKGVYVPFWLYSGELEADVSYEAEQSEVTTRGDERITTTHHYAVRRKGVMEFEKIPADASSKMPDDLMDSVEPYDYSGLKKFEMEYLPGYLADKYDVDAQSCKTRAQNRAVNSALDVMRESLDSKYDSVREQTSKRNIRFLRSNEEYAMFPVWLLATKWGDESLLFAMNGQTGKMTGNLPVDKKKLILWVLGVAVVAFGLSAWLFAADSMILPIVVTLIAGFLTYSVLMAGMKPVKQRSTAREYLTSADGRTGSSGKVRFSIKEDHFIRTTTERQVIRRENH